ncbi:hypothetical protein MHBO_000604 [Bonamia ostreae]|uniref:Uncharacterized protein n=1 Tax=Bonamia ostreae TaxID=126728 RepID=A0ABV2AGR7_9EUKA
MNRSQNHSETIRNTFETTLVDTDSEISYTDSENNNETLIEMRERRNGRLAKQRKRVSTHRSNNTYFAGKSEKEILRKKFVNFFYKKLPQSSESEEYSDEEIEENALFNRFRSY